MILMPREWIYSRRAFHCFYWAVPYGETTAKNGRWRKGPGMDLVGTLTRWFPELEIIAGIGDRRKIQCPPGAPPCSA